MGDHAQDALGLLALALRIVLHRGALGREAAGASGSLAGAAVALPLFEVGEEEICEKQGNASSRTMTTAELPSLSTRVPRMADLVWILPRLGSLPGYRKYTDTSHQRGYGVTRSAGLNLDYSPTRNTPLHKCGVCFMVREIAW